MFKLLMSERDTGLKYPMEPPRLDELSDNLLEGLEEEGEDVDDAGNAASPEFFIEIEFELTLLTYKVFHKIWQI